jgi:hypothetical protein
MSNRVFRKEKNLASRVKSIDARLKGYLLFDEQFNLPEEITSSLP